MRGRGLLVSGFAVALMLQLPDLPGLAQDMAAPPALEDVVVLGEELEPWVSPYYWDAALCYETIGQLINEHQAFTDANRLANAQKLRDALGAVIDAARNEKFAKGLTFEQSMAIDNYFYAFSQPKTARFVATRQAAALAIDLRFCPGAVVKLQEHLN